MCLTVQIKVFKKSLQSPKTVIGAVVKDLSEGKFEEKIVFNSSPKNEPKAYVNEVTAMLNLIDLSCGPSLVTSRKARNSH